MMFLAFLIILVEKSEESEGRLQPMSFEALRTTLSSFVLSGCMTEPDKHGESEDTFNSRPIKVGHGNSTDTKLFELPQEVESLCFTDLYISVELP